MLAKFITPTLVEHGRFTAATRGSGLGTVEEHAPANDGESSPEATAPTSDTTQGSPQ